MTKLPSEELAKLIDIVLAKHAWTQDRLAKEIGENGVGAHTISRWRKSGGIHKVHYEELLRLANDEAAPAPAGIVSAIPFSLTIPRESLKITVDKDGNFNIQGLITLDQKEK